MRLVVWRFLMVLGAEVVISLASHNQKLLLTFLTLNMFYLLIDSERYRRKVKRLTTDRNAEISVKIARTQKELNCPRQTNCEEISELVIDGGF
ncbi:hypothetical protein ACHOLT_18595 [Desulfitobacterium sp. Sab5]|uniref:hypothetical protein n=1 Tax=Desulfitobacterium nosdiversum TaxID=3375356 RepID=UPI003CF7BBF5